MPTVYEFRPEFTMAQGSWTNSMARYAARVADVTFEVSYAPGGVAGSNATGSQLGAALYYAGSAPLKAGVAYLDSRDSVNGSHSKAWAAGASYEIADTRVNVG